MRFAAYVVALFFFEVQSQQQCSESLGTCSGSRASLMQVKSFSQKMQTSTGRGTSKHAETLAGFQKYTLELVDKYLEDPQEQQSGLGSEVTAAINIIRDYLESLYQDLLLFHYQDGNASEWCAGSAQRCLDHYLPNDVLGKLNTFDYQVAQKRESHRGCQVRLKEECDPTTPAPPACPDYHTHREKQEGTFPACGKGGYLKSEYQTASFAVSALNTMLKHFEGCLDNMQPWLDPLYNKYTGCEESESSSNIEPADCAAEQLNFEDAYCERVTYRDTHCDNFDTCIQHSEDHCVNGATKGQPAVCTQIEANWKARQSEMETAKRIECLLDVLTSADADKATGLQKCHTHDFSEEIAFWVINCFTNDEKPAGGVCTRDPDSCGDEFVGSYYFNFTVRQEGEATCCSNGEGNCREECKASCSSS